jgi:putative ABC transport system permease protein
VFARMRHRWQALFHRREWESNLNDELQGHVDNRAEDLIRRGLTPAEAERQARMELGSREACKEQCREEHGLRWPDEIKRDSQRWPSCRWPLALVPTL